MWLNNQASKHGMKLSQHSDATQNLLPEHVAIQIGERHYCGHKFPSHLSPSLYRPQSESGPCSPRSRQERLHLLPQYRQWQHLLPPGKQLTGHVIS